MDAIYFDGLSSKKQNCELGIEGDQIIISDADTSHIIGQWRLTDTKIDRYRSQKVLDLSHDHSLARITVLGAKADEWQRILLPRQSAINQLYQQMLGESAFKIVTIGLLSMLSIIILYLTIIAPGVARFASNLLPMKTEIALGDQIKHQIVDPLDIDSSNSVELQAFYDLVGFKSEYPIRLYLANDEVTHAFAIPGGHIVIYQNMLNQTRTWQELAALMAHELAHINQRHSVKALAQNLSSYLLISVLTGDVGGISSLILENAGRLRNLSHSRSAEKDADLMGLSYLSEQNISTRSMVDLFSNMLQNSDNQSLEFKLPELFSTHPIGPKRITYLQEATEELIPTSTHLEHEKLQAIWYKLTQEET